jgi:transcriptional regulator with GAF, ATPase, and Fis domain
MAQQTTVLPEPGAGTRSFDLLQALSRALQVLGTAGDESGALGESFDFAARAFAAEKALLLRVRGLDPIDLESLRVVGLEFDQVVACIRGQSVPGVSPSLIRRAVESQAPQLVENSQFEGMDASATGSLRGRPHSVVCAPVVDPWTHSVLAVLYFQSQPGPRGYSAADLPFLQAYATALGHAFGLYLTTERKYRALEEDWRRLSSSRSSGAPEIIGDSEEMRLLRAKLHETFLPATEARHPRPLLILGDTGTGKDMVARYLHYYSSTRGKGAFVDYNCAGLSGELAASILFGHVRGAFTGAVDSAPGLLRSAHKGTLFLDEVGELPPRGQELLLKILDHWTVQPVGEARSHPVDVQLVCATNKDLAAIVEDGRFRHDLYHRLKALTIRLSPLVSRPGDIRTLLAHYLAEAERAQKKRTRGLTGEALATLLSYAWPGNVRELAGVCAALVTHGRAGEVIGLDDIRAHCPEVLGGKSRTGAAFARRMLEGSLEDARGEFERDFFLQRLELHRWSVPEAARSMGISTSTLYRYLQRHGLGPRDGAPRG